MTGLDVLDVNILLDTFHSNRTTENDNKVSQKRLILPAVWDGSVVAMVARVLDRSPLRLPNLSLLPLLLLAVASCLSRKVGGAQSIVPDIKSAVLQESRVFRMRDALLKHRWLKNIVLRKLWIMWWYQWQFCCSCAGNTQQHKMVAVVLLLLQTPWSVVQLGFCSATMYPRSMHKMIFFNH